MNRWVVRPLLELAYVTTALYAGIVTFTVAVTLLAVGIALVPVFLIGIPVLVATVYIVHGMAWMERLRAETFLDVRLPARPRPRSTRRGTFARPLSLVQAPEFWKETAYCLALLPLGAVAALAPALYSAAVAGLALPLYITWLPGDDGVTWLELPQAVQAALGFLAGVICFALAVVLATALARANLALVSSLLTPTDNERLRTQVSDLRTSRARVVDAADAERRRIERDLHDGAQQHLVTLAMNLGRAQTKFDDDPETARALVAEAHQAAKDSITELRNVIRGVHPAVLSDRGLDAALSALAARSPIPVRIDVDVAERPNATTEAVAYFVVSEALTNASRHSEASRIDVEVRREGDSLRVQVSDDGRGGAGEPEGGGLAGLRDRVQAVDGTFHLASPSSGGTTLTAELPCAS